MSDESSRRCPCGRGPAYDDCCGRLHRGDADAVSAEELMRSRYSAFVTGDAPYLSRTWHPDARPARLHLGDGSEWTGLEIRSTSRGGMLDQEGTVEFVAHHRRRGTDGELHETSRFTRLDGRWVYVGPEPV